ncbi:MAG TPA: ABC transporter permease [Mycobacterium sp.]
MPSPTEAAATIDVGRRSVRLSGLRRPAIPRVGRWLTAEVIATCALAIIVALAALGPLLSPYSSIVPSGEALLAPLSPGHPLGTDELGFDILTRVLAGLRITLFAAVVVTAVSVVVGLVIGTLAGWLGGWIDAVLMRATDLILAFPATIVAMAIVASLGAGLTSSIIGIAIVWWPLYARLVRGEVRRAATGRHVEAAGLGGTRGIRLLIRHVLPAVGPTVVVTASMDIGGVVMTLAALAFIGLGSPAPAPELGLMASAGMEFILSAWWIAVVPGVAVAVLALVCNYVGDGLRLALRSTGV